MKDIWGSISYDNVEEHIVQYINAANYINYYIYLILVYRAIKKYLNALLGNSSLTAQYLNDGYK